MTRDFDPRSGEVNYRLRNIRRGEPDAALMRPPADYSQPEPRPDRRPRPLPRAERQLLRKSRWRAVGT